MTTYTPTGTGHCATCGRDVRAHDGGHEYAGDSFALSVIAGEAICKQCGDAEGADVHDIGRVLRCPEVEGGAQADRPIHGSVGKPSAAPDLRDGKLDG